MRRLNQWLTGGRPRPAGAPRQRARLGIHALETREVPAVVLANGVLTVTGDDPGIGGNDTIEILSPTDGQTVVRVNGQQQFAGSDLINRVEIDGRAGVDTVAIRGVRSGIADGVRVRNSEIVTLGETVAGTGLQSLANVRSDVRVERAAIFNVFDTAFTGDRTVVVGLQSVTGLGPARISYSLGPEAIFTIRTGGGADTFRIENTPEALTQFFSGAGADTFDLERSIGNVRITGEAGADAVTVRSVPQGFGRTLGRVTVNDGSFQDRVTVNDDAAAENADFFDSYTATLTADRLDVRVTARSQLGNRLLPVGFNRTIDLNRVGAVDYRAPTRQATTSQIDVQAVNRFTEVLVDAGGTTLTRLGSPARTLNGIVGRTAVTGGLPGSRLVLDDGGRTTGRTYAVGGGGVTFPDGQIGQRSIGFAGFLGAVEVQAGDGADQFTVTGLRADGRTVSLDGSLGSDTLVGPDRDNLWDITGATVGTLNGQVAFRLVNNLTGRAGDDTFRFADQARLNGRIDGGGGFDTLDYSAYTTSVTVGLAAGTATNVVGGVANIRNVFGGSAADTLSGNSLSNVLVGNGGGDTLNGGPGTARDVLIGGRGADQLRTGGTADILYVGGDVAAADRNNVASMKAVLTEWLQASDLATRVQNLAAGVGPGGTVRLNPDVLDPDGFADTFTPGPGPDVFYREPLDAFSGNFLPGPSDILVTV